MDAIFNSPLINPNLDKESILEEFKTNRVVVIEDYLRDDAAERIHQYLTEDMPTDWWRVSTAPKLNGEDGFDIVPNSDEFEQQIKQNYIHSLNAFKNGQFSYCFHRTVKDHSDECGCFECNLRQWLVSDENISFLNQVIDVPVTTTDEVFAAVYLPGDFLSPHVDSPNGSVGFVYQLTKNWKAQFGGNLHFLDNETSEVERVEVPTFNTLTLFDLPKGVGKLHYVSHVSPGVEELRLTYTGWYK